MFYIIRMLVGGLNDWEGSENVGLQSRCRYDIDAINGIMRAHACMLTLDGFNNLQNTSSN